MTIDQRLAKQRDINQRKYAQRLVSDKETWMPDFELRAKLYGREWGDRIWKLCGQIKRGEV